MKKVEIEQRELDALRAVANAARHLVGMSQGVPTREPRLFFELNKRKDARVRLEEAVDHLHEVSQALKSG